MAEPISATFRVLAANAADVAERLLLTAVDVPVESIQASAVNALVRRSSQSAQLEVLKRYDRLPALARTEVANAGRLLLPLYERLLNQGDGELRALAHRRIVTDEILPAAVFLVDCLATDDGPVDRQILDTLRALLDRLCEQLAAPTGMQTAQDEAAARAVREKFVAAADRLINQFERIHAPEEFVELTLTVANAGDAVLRKLLMQSAPVCRQLTIQTLQSSTHPGVMRLLLGFLKLNLPYPKALELISDRQDLEFATSLLRWLPERPAAVVTRNLQQIEHLAWLNPRLGLLDLLPESLQIPLFRLIGFLGLPVDQKQELREWILRHGAPAARDLALESLQSLGRSVLQGVVTEELTAEETKRRAWALGHVRDQKIPEAFSLLVAALDDDEPEIREVAREQLSAFGLQQMLDRLDDMTPQEAGYSGKLLRKIEPDFATALRQELQHPIRRKRLLAARGAVMLGLLPDVVGTVLDWLADEDPMMRRSAVETLSHCPTSQVLQALLPLENDPSLRVRQAVSEVLSLWSQSAHATTTPVLRD